MDLLDPTRSEARVADLASLGTDPAVAVTALYQVHAVELIRIAIAMLGDRTAAEDVVQDAFFGLYRRWSHLRDPDKALAYARSAVLNGCKSHLRAMSRASCRPAAELGIDFSAEQQVLIAEEHVTLLAALRRLPSRQREVLLLRYFLDLPEAEIARSMNISQGTVKSTASRAIAALGRQLREDS